MKTRVRGTGNGRKYDPVEKGLPNLNIAKRMDYLARDLMAKASDGTLPLEERVGIFKEIAKWVAIKNKLDDSGSEGSGIDEYRNRLKSAAAGGAPDPGPDARARPVKPPKPEFAIVGEPEGSRLAELRRRLPPVPGDNGGGGLDLEREAPVTVGGSRGFSIGLGGGPAAGDGEPDRDGDL